MADSVDRVFSHALNTVNKIQPGKDKPPSAARLKLYGLYKQSMEGDVEGIMIKPTGRDEKAQRGREKWDAWKSCSGLSRTEAKRRYISTLIETMRKYASQEPDSRELVDELEFVWDQVKSNVASSSSSSPVHTTSGLGINRQDSPPPQPTSAFSFLNRNMRRLGGGNTVVPPKKQSTDLRVLTNSPLSHSQVDESEDDAEAEEFHDAPDSQLADPRPSNPHPAFSEDNHSSHSRQNQTQQDNSQDPQHDKKAISKRPHESNSRWRKRIESALVKMTAEVAALREQLEAKTWAKARTKRGTIEGIAWSIFSFFLKMIAVDLIILVFVLLYLRRKKDGRLEGAIRVLLGDAVAQVQRVGSGVGRQAQKSVGLVVGKMALGASVRKAQLPSGGRAPGNAA